MRYRVIVEIDEVDIGRVAPGQDGAAGAVVAALGPAMRWSSSASRRSRKAVDGRNVFEVEARLLQPPPGLRPGLLGRAELVVGQRPPLWAWTGHALDRIRAGLVDLDRLTS